MALNTIESVIPRFMIVIMIAAVCISFASSATYHRQPEESKIPNKYIIAVKEGRVDRFMETYSRQLRLQQRAEFTRDFKRFIPDVSLDSTTLDELLQDDNVDYIEEDGRVSIDLASWGIDRIDQTNLPLDNQKIYKGCGSGTHIYIIDTGTMASHSQFGGRVSTTDGYDYWGGPIGQDCHGHGTHCGGTAGGSTVGVATAAKLYSVKVLNCGGGGSFSSVLGGMAWVANNAHQPAVASMSLGGGASVTLNNAVDLMVNADVVVSVAAGNSYGADACNYSPASAEKAITVGATSSSDNIAAFSNVGPCVDIFAPGEGITSAWNNGLLNTISGTSMACPHVSGAAAILREIYPTLSPEAIAGVLVGIATQNVITGIPAGTPNRLLYIGSDICSPNPCWYGNCCVETCKGSRECKCRRTSWYYFYGEKCQHIRFIATPGQTAPGPVSDA